MEWLLSFWHSKMAATLESYVNRILLLFQIEKNIVYVQLVDFIQVVLAYQCSSFVFNQRASDCFDSYFPSVMH